nr:hypothetical protein [Micromonospora sp. DSM 115978]
MGFKEDADFARFLTMGAYGAAAVKADLELRGHRIIELERYALANKVWSVKVKRLRLPDLLCVFCGRRFEAKAKSRLEIKLSHSGTDGRAWYSGGMRHDDVFAFLRVVLGGDAPRIGRPLYVTRAGLESAIETVKDGVRKAISQGAEADVKWPVWVPSYSGALVGRDGADPACVVVQSQTGRIQKYRSGLAWPRVHTYLDQGEQFEANSTIVAGPVPPADTQCPGKVWDWENDLSSAEQDSRYPAIKAARFRVAEGTHGKIPEIALNGSEDWRVRLEAVALLAAAETRPWPRRLGLLAVDTSRPVEQQMEAVLVLSEIPRPFAADILAEVAVETEARHQDVRAAAVWGLGLGATADPIRSLSFAADPNDLVALHSVAALPVDLPLQVASILSEWMTGGDERQAASAATILARHGEVGRLLEVTASGGSGALFAVRALGDLPREVVEAKAGRPLRPEEIQVLAPIWIQHSDWLRRPQNAHGLEALANQRIRF